MLRKKGSSSLSRRRTHPLNYLGEPCRDKNLLREKGGRGKRGYYSSTSGGGRLGGRASLERVGGLLRWNPGRGLSSSKKEGAIGKVFFEGHSFFCEKGSGNLLLKKT